MTKSNKNIVWYDFNIKELIQMHGFSTQTAAAVLGG